MTRDYAKPSGRRGLPIVPVLTGIAIGCGIALIVTVLITPLPENEQRLIQNTPTDLIAEDEAALRAAAKPSLPPQQPARFKFYELLPNLEIIPFEDPTPPPQPRQAPPQPGDTRPAAQAPAPQPGTPADPSERFWIQAGSFRSADDAESRRVNLILLGFAPRVEAANIPGKGAFHRVKIGPLATADSARAAMQRLKGEGIDSYVQREKIN